MPCVRIEIGYICSNRWFKLKRRGTSTRAWWVEHHPYLGPSFYVGNGDGQRLVEDFNKIPAWCWPMYFSTIDALRKAGKHV